MTSGRHRVIVVDDDRHIRVAARVLLGAEGFDVLTLGSAAAALNAVRSKGATAVIIDFDIEHHAGVKLAASLSNDTTLQGVVVIGVASDLGEFPFTLVDFAIQKPYATRALARVVREVIEAIRAA